MNYKKLWDVLSVLWNQCVWLVFAIVSFCDDWSCFIVHSYSTFPPIYFVQLSNSAVGVGLDLLLVPLYFCKIKNCLVRLFGVWCFGCIKAYFHRCHWLLSWFRLTLVWIRVLRQHSLLVMIFFPCSEVHEVVVFFFPSFVTFLFRGFMLLSTWV